ncbi:MAG: STAS/SEC14 domain-containing protein [Oleiphilaceae bacterium]|nr:STAS/SEC14 domain-containing protein [Oleiphilaceae bacterium]
MLHVKIDDTTGIATLSPDAALSQEDFEYAAQRIDAHIEKSGPLKGLIINTRHFPGWKSFGSLISHLRFFREHHKDVAKVAVVTDSSIGEVSEKVTDHFLEAEVRHFPFDDLKEAEEWILAQ